MPLPALARKFLTPARRCPVCGLPKNTRCGPAAALYDAILIKENHIAAAGGIETVLAAARKETAPGIWMQIEVENLSQLRKALDAGATLILLDNMNLDQMREAVRLAGERAELEASGGITLENVRSVAETGVHRISIGGLTKDLRAVDFSMRFES